MVQILTLPKVFKFFQLLNFVLISAEETRSHYEGPTRCHQSMVVGIGNTSEHGGQDSGSF